MVVLVGALLCLPLPEALTPTGTASAAAEPDPLRLTGTITWSYTFTETDGNPTSSLNYRESSASMSGTLVASLMRGQTQYYDPGSNSYLDLPTWLDDGTSRITGTATRHSFSARNGGSPANSGTCTIDSAASLSGVRWTELRDDAIAAGWMTLQGSFFGFTVFPGSWPYDPGATRTNLRLNPSEVPVGSGATFTAVPSGSSPPPCPDSALGVPIIPPAGADPSNGPAIAGTVQDLGAGIPLVDFHTLPQFADYVQEYTSSNGPYSAHAHLSVEGVLSVDEGADLAVTVSDAPDPAAVGENLTYTVTVRNNGPWDASDVTVSDAPPAGLTLVSATPSQGAPCAGTTQVSCALGSLQAQHNAAVTIVGRPTPAQAGRTITNVANVTAAQRDPDGANNSARTDTFVSVPLWVSLVDFDSAPFAHDIDVVRDQLAPAAHQTIDAFAEACPTSHDRVEWKDCNTDGLAGVTEKNWPVAYVRGSPIVVKEARFKVGAGASLSDVKVTGTVASLGLRFEQQGVSQTGDELVLHDVVSTGTLPDSVGFIPNLRIQWRVEVNGHELDAGTSSHPVYTLLRPPQGTLYLNLVDFTSRDASGMTTEPDVAAAIWDEFTDRSVERRELDPQSGQVRGTGVPFEYWTPGWTVESAIDGSYFSACPTTLNLLTTGVGRCAAWAVFLQNALAVHGIDGRSVTAGKLPGFPTGPAGAQYMLVKTWTFGTPTGIGDFPYLMKLKKDATGKLVKVKADFQDAAGVAGQGRADPNPPGWFVVGDHAVVTYAGRIYDPAYGTGPFSSIDEWARASLDGYARVTKVKPDEFKVEAHRGVP